MIEKTYVKALKAAKKVLGTERVVCQALLQAYYSGNITWQEGVDTRRMIVGRLAGHDTVISWLANATHKKTLIAERSDQALQYRFAWIDHMIAEFEAVVKKAKADKKDSTKIIKPFGKVWVNDSDQYHRVGKPAVIYDNGRTAWYEHGKRHREDGPAIEDPDGPKEWWLKGERHRLDGPAIDFATGYKEWCVNGKRHRLDGPAVEDPPGREEYWVNGKLHRDDGPAFKDASGSKRWYRNGKLHRDDGPAIENSDGTKFWYQDGFMMATGL